MQVTLNVSTPNNQLCEIVSRSVSEYCISSASNLSNTVLLNSFGVRNKVLLDTSD